MSSLFLNPILRPRWHDPADATPGIDHITRSAWDDVNVGVHDRLPRCWAIVEADIKPIRL